MERGRAEGMERGRAEGMERGRAEGMERGRAEGMEQGKVDIVLEMLRDKLPLEMIARISKFSMERVQELGRMHSLLWAAKVKRRRVFNIRDSRKNYKERAVAHTVRQSFFFIKKWMRFKFMNKIGFFSCFLPERVDLFSKRVIMSKNES